MHMPHGLNVRHLKQLLLVFGQGFTRSAFAKFVTNPELHVAYSQHVARKQVLYDLSIKTSSGTG